MGRGISQRMRCFFWLAICMAPSCYSYRYGEKNEIKVYVTPSFEEGGRDGRGINIKTLPALGKEWTVTFDFTPSAIPTPVWMKWAPGKGYRNGIFSLSGFDPKCGIRDGCWYGQYKMIMYEQFEKGKGHLLGFYVYPRIQRKTAYRKVVKIPSSLAEDKKTTFKISQEMHGERLMFKVDVDGEEKISVELTQIQPIHKGAVDVNVGGFEGAVPGIMTNLKIETEEEKGELRKMPGPMDP